MNPKPFFLLTLLLVFFISTTVFAQQEEITLSTYYPAPFGEYDELCAEKLLVDLPSAAELQDMDEGDCHITRSLIVGTVEGGFSYDALNAAVPPTPLYDGDVIIEGSVGIGTTVPGAKFHIDNPSYWGDQPGNTPDLVAQGERAAIVLYDDTTPAAAASIRGIMNDDGMLQFSHNDYSAGDLGYIGKTTDMIIDTSGNVGIGTSTFGQYEKVHIAGPGPVAVNIEGTTDGALRLVGTTPPATLWEVASRSDGRFGILQSGVGDRFVINTSGNVGIGTTAPEYGTLDIVSPYSKTDTTLRNVLRLRTNDAANPFDLKVTVTGAAALKDRTFRLQTGDHLLSNDGNLAIQPYGGSVSIFGSWTDNDSNGNPLVRDAVYRATTDGFVIARWEGISEVAITGLTDGNNPPTSRRAQNVKYSAAYQGISFTMPVRKGDYWKVYNAAWMHWLPIGNGLCERQ